MALEYKERSFWLDPYDIGNVIYANILLLDKKFAKALEVCDILEKVDETRMSKFLRGEIYYYMGDFDRSRSVFEQLMADSLEYKIGALYYLAMISAGKGEASQAKKNMEEIEYLSPNEFVYFEKELKLASIWAGLGEKVLAYKTLEAFLNDPRNQKDFYIYKKYIELDNNFLQMRQDKVFMNNFNVKGETHGKKQDN
jgi:tetratricopeptide (TPR) repeat protein